MAVRPLVRRSPCSLVDIFVWETCAADDKLSVRREVDQPVSVIRRGVMFAVDALNAPI